MPLPDRAVCQARLAQIFPEALPQRDRLTNQLAASAVFVFLYTGSIDRARQIRPSMVLWMSDEAAREQRPDSREAWYEAASRSKRAVGELLASWGFEHRPWYADNTREPLRDETFRAWAQVGAALRDESVATTSPKPQWSLDSQFAQLFDPDLGDEELAERIDDWQDDHLGPVGRARIALSRQLAGPGEEVIVRLPGGATRTLAPGGSSLLIKGVIEIAAPALLGKPAVLSISESRRHVDIVDAALLLQLGLRLDEGRLLPDALLFDAEDGTFWFVEAVFTDGAITDNRKAALEAWAGARGIPAGSCRFLSAFVGRNAAPFRRLAASLAWGSAVWFLDEPDRVMRLEALTN